MQLEAEDNLCVVCLLEECDPNREDGMCNLCGQTSDRYNTDPDELFLND